MTLEIPAKKGRVSIKAAVWIVAVFILGAVCGIGGTAIVATHRLQSAFRENLRDSAHPQGPADRILDRFEDKLTRELELTAGEQAAVSAELDITRRQIGEVRTGVGRDMRRIAIGSVLRVGRVLPQEKRRAFREMARKRLEPWGLELRRAR